MGKHLAAFFVSTLACVMSASANPLAAPDDASSTNGVSSTFSMSEKTQVPGDTLKPGTYSIQILDHLSDRMVVRVAGTLSKSPVVFLAVTNRKIASASSSGAVMWNSDLKSVPALRGFSFPSGYTVEFVYPKAEAAELARANTDRVVAIDPQSEGRPVLRKMSPEDMQMINLWMLSLTTAGPNDKAAILAQKYQDHSGKGVQTAAAPVRANPIPAPQTQIAELAKPRFQSTQASLPSAPRRHPAIASLPHTGSYLPSVVLAGLLSLFAMAGIRLWLFLNPSSTARNA